MPKTEAQKRAQKKWNEKNKEKTRVQGYFRTAKMFINNNATLDELLILKELIADRENNLNKIS